MNSDIYLHAVAGFPLSAISFLLAIWLAVFLDVLLGDPRCWPHPVMLIARIAGGLEMLFRRKIVSERRAGQVLVSSTLLLWLLGMGILFVSLYRLSPLALFVVSTVLLYTTLALRSLADHALDVYQQLEIALKTKELQSARKSIARIVGRETTELSEEGIVRACVETVAENLSDGVVSPLFYAFSLATTGCLSGFDEYALPLAATGAMLYKVVNTMDSMFGYKNEKYINFGRCAAVLDDVVNWIPARISALALVAATLLTKDNFFQSAKIFLRDRRQHASPNAGYPEAAMAGALGLQLGGDAAYFGRTVHKPTIGDPLRSLQTRQILAAVRLMRIAVFLIVLTFSSLYFAVVVITVL